MMEESRRRGIKPTGPIYVAIDVGTSSAKALAVDIEGRIVGESRVGYRSSSPHPGWAEQDPNDWTRSAVSALSKLIRSLPDPKAVKAIGLTGQSPTVAPVDRAGAPVGPGMLYRDNRAVAEAEDISERLGDDEVHRLTGQVPGPFHIAPKLLWMRKHQTERFERANHFLQPRDLVLHALTGEFATDETHANSTLLFDLTRRGWSSALFSSLDLDETLFPPVFASGTEIGNVVASISDELGLSQDCRVVIGGADSQAAAYGSGVCDPGPVSEMAGTSSCINAALLAPVSELRISQYAHVVPDRYTSELGINTTGGAVQWAVLQLGFADYAALEDAAAETHDALRGSLSQSPREIAPLFLPFLADGDRGDSRLRGGFIGLSDRHGRAELAYSVLEGIAFSVAFTLDALREAGIPVEELRVAGGAAALDRLGSIKADGMGLPVRHMRSDSAAVGTALLAARSSGSVDEASSAVARGVSEGRVFEPDEQGHRRLQDRAAWYESIIDSSAIRTSDDWTKNND
jgi:xylulokinase